ncbi:hypothetical protein C8Q80DRAFT_585585 [Daedaleopsis nitida]|nr:hypothetical protein C8Q80DRAFT_585585 [Daedaleopsis nitida]
MLSALKSGYRLIDTAWNYGGRGACLGGNLDDLEHDGLQVDGRYGPTLREEFTLRISVPHIDSFIVLYHTIHRI